MSYNSALKIRAQKLRRQGKSYSEILSKILVAKSTLSLWLKEVGLSKHQNQKLTEKKRLGQLRGALKRKTIRISAQQEIYAKSQKEIGALSKRELWLLGIALYWAEGSKEKEYQSGIGVRFSNSDPRMIVLFLRWLKRCCDVKSERVYFSVYIHAMYKNRTMEVRKYWSDMTKFPLTSFKQVYFKNHNVQTRRKNAGILYNGLLRVNVRSSSELNRKITGWVIGICEGREK